MSADKRYHRYLQNTIEHDITATNTSMLVYGPRQVGKTTLVKSFVRDGRDAYLSCDDAAVARSLVPITQTLENVVRPFERVVYTMPAYVTGEADLRRICQVMRDWFGRA